MVLPLPQVPHRAKVKPNPFPSPPLFLAPLSPFIFTRFFFSKGRRPYTTLAHTRYEFLVDEADERDIAARCQRTASQEATSKSQAMTAKINKEKDDLQAALETKAEELRDAADKISERDVTIAALTREINKLRIGVSEPDPAPSTGMAAETQGESQKSKPPIPVFAAPVSPVPKPPLSQSPNLAQAHPLPQVGPMTPEVLVANISTAFSNAMATAFNTYLPALGGQQSFAALPPGMSTPKDTKGKEATNNTDRSAGI